MIRIDSRACFKFKLYLYRASHGFNSLQRARVVANEVYSYLNGTLQISCNCCGNMFKVNDISVGNISLNAPTYSIGVPVFLVRSPNISRMMGKIAQLVTYHNISRIECKRCDTVFGNFHRNRGVLTLFPSVRIEVC